MAPKNDRSTKKVMNKGAWTAEEDRKLAEYIEIHGAKRWKTVASIAGLNRCGKSCRLRWLNYLRPNIKRGNISDDEEDLILRLHKLLGNRWSLIAGRLPGRTDNEIKNYWNSHLIKKIKQKNEKPTLASTAQETSITSTTSTTPPQKAENESSSARADKNEEERVHLGTSSEGNFDVNEFFDFSTEGSYGLEWVNKFLELDEDPMAAAYRENNNVSIGCLKSFLFWIGARGSYLWDQYNPTGRDHTNHPIWWFCGGQSNKTEQQRPRKARVIINLSALKNQQPRQIKATIIINGHQHDLFSCSYAGVLPSKTKSFIVGT